jgi:hypothetical protein
MIIQVVSRRGGIGTSALAWCLANAADAPALLIDLSNHAGGVRWVSGAGDINTSWPIFFGTEWSDNLSMQFDRLMYSAGHVSLFSGGSVPPENILNSWLQTQSKKLIVVDGELWNSALTLTTVHHSTNSLQEWNDFQGDIKDLHVIQLRVGGLPRKYFIDEIGLKSVFFYAHQKAVRNSLELGLGVHTSSKMCKVARVVLQHVEH